MKQDYHNPNDHWYYNRKLMNSEGSYKACFYCLVGILVIVVLCMLLSGCKTVYVPVETVKTEYINKTDTIKQTDSIFREKETIIREADSTLIAKLGLKLKDNEKAILILQRQLEKELNKYLEHRVDTFIKVDSIHVPYLVEKPLTKWQSIKMDMGGIAIGALIFMIAALIVWGIIKIRK